MSVRKEELVRPFIEARIAEDRASLADLREVAWDEASMMRGHVARLLQQRVALTEQILEAAHDLLDSVGDGYYHEHSDDPWGVYETVGLVLARQWSEHPTFRPEWSADWTPPPVSVVHRDRPPRPDPAESDDRFTLTTMEASERDRRSLEEQRDFNNRLREGVLDTRALEAMAVGVWPELDNKAMSVIDSKSSGRTGRTAETP